MVSYIFASWCILFNILVVEDNQNGIKAALASGANLLKVETVNDVTYQNIKNRIREIESSGITSDSKVLMTGGAR